MGFWNDPKERHSPKKYDPYDYADKTGVTVIGQAQPPAGMVTAAQPVQAQLAPAQPGPPQPFYPTPAQAPVQPGAVAPAFAPPDQLDAQRRQEGLRGMYEGAGMAAPQPQREAPLGKDLHIPSRELRDAPRDRPAPKPAAKAGPAPAPAEAPLIPLDTPGTAESKMSGDSAVQRYRKLRDQIQTMRDAGKTVTPERLENLKKARRDADARVKLIAKEDRAATEKEQTADDATAKKAADAALKAKEKESDAKAGKDADRASAQLLGRAQTAVKDRPDAARKMAEEGMKNARTTTEAKAFQSVLDNIAANEKAAGAKAEKEKAATEQAENKRNARAMQPAVDTAKNGLADAQAALTAAIAALIAANKALAAEPTLTSSTPETVAAAKQKIAAAEQDVAAKKLARNQASGLLSTLENTMADAEAGIADDDEAAPAPDTDPAGEMQAGQEQVPEGTTATHPETGQRVVMKQGQWVPL